MTQNFYPNDQRNLKNSEGAILEKLRYCETMLGHLRTDGDITPEEGHCIKALELLVLSYNGILYEVGYNTVN